MNNFIDLKSPSWWFGVVVVAFVINIASAYAKPLLDRGMARFSDRRRRKLERAKIDLNQEAEKTERRPDGMVLLALEELKLVLAALVCTSFGVLVLVFVSVAFARGIAPTELLLVIPLLLFLAGACLHAAVRKATLLKLLHERRRENQGA